jgi:threonylcarbamoyladenosine tRNA methylthiotransferase MtaB
MHDHPTLAVTTLGCRTNQAETAEWVARLSHVLALAPPGHEADVVLIHTCSVTHEADRQSFQAVRRAHRRHPGARIVVTGCSASQHREAYEALDGVALVAPHDARDIVVQAVTSWYGARDRGWVPPSPRESGHSRAWLKVSEGCDNRCSFCIVPSLRGGEESLPSEELAGRARLLAEAGYREIVLTGTHLGGYRDAQGSDLTALLGRLLEATPDAVRFRLSSIEPIDFPVRLAAMLAHPRVCPHVHLCLQSGSSAVLARMRRRYHADRYRQIVSGLRSVRPDVTLTTDVIVGFPGETEDEFQDTLAFVREIGFAGIHPFPFSVREGTHAATLPDRVDPVTTGQRMDRLMALAETLRADWMASFVGREVEAVLERTATETRPGTSDHGLRVRVPAHGTRAGERWRLRVTRVDDTGVEAELLERLG